MDCVLPGGHTPAMRPRCAVYRPAIEGEDEVMDVYGVI